MLNSYLKSLSRNVLYIKTATISKMKSEEWIKLYSTFYIKFSGSVAQLGQFGLPKSASAFYGSAEESRRSWVQIPADPPKVKGIMSQNFIEKGQTPGSRRSHIHKHVS